MFLSGVSYLASLDVKLPYFETACRDTNNHPIDLMKALLAGTHTFNKGLKNLSVSQHKQNLLSFGGLKYGTTTTMTPPIDDGKASPGVCDLVKLPRGFMRLTKMIPSQHGFLRWSQHGKASSR